MRKSGLSLALVLILLLSFAAFAYAQDATEEATTEPMAEATMEATQDMTSASTGSIACSSDLIASLYVADRYFGFSQFNDEWMQSGASTLDLNQFDRGQFSPLFDSMMNMDMSGMTDDQRSAVTSMMLMDDATMQQNMMSNAPSATMLNPSVFTGEPGECSMLRTTLDRFFQAVAFQDLNMGANTTSANPEATTEPGAEATTEAGASTGSTRENVNYSTTLSGSAEVPGPGDDDATGTAAITIDFANSQVCYNVTVQNLTLPAAAMHIHNANAGESGPVVVPFDKAPDASGNATGCVLVSDMDLLNQIADSPLSFYVNVHTSDFPDGAARGQLGG